MKWTEEDVIDAFAKAMEEAENQPDRWVKKLLEMAQNEGMAETTPEEEM